MPEWTATKPTSQLSSSYHRQVDELSNAVALCVKAKPQYLATGAVDETIIAGTSGLSTQRVLLYFEAARDIEPFVREHLTASEYLLLADMAYSYSGSDSASDYVARAIERAKANEDVTGTAIVLSTLAKMQYDHFPRTSIEKGREYYREAQILLESLTEAKKSAYTEAGLWVDWAIDEGGLQSQSQPAGGEFSKKTSAGVRKPRQARGRWLSWFSTARTAG